MKPNPIKFGTDGWRAIIADDFTFENVRYCAQGVADYLKETGLASRGIVIGYDTRFDSEEFAAAAAEVIAGNGIKAYLAPGPAPTPVISYSVLAYKAGGAIIITASHNPGIWNGFKYKNEHGSSAADEITSKIVGFIDTAYSAGKVNRLATGRRQKTGASLGYRPRPRLFRAGRQARRFEKAAAGQTEAGYRPHVRGRRGLFKKASRWRQLEADRNSQRT